MTEKEFLSHPEYPYKDFLEDFLALQQLPHPDALRQAGAQAVGAHFQSRYPNAELRQLRMRRCLKAVLFWLDNRDSLNSGNLAVVGQKNTLISQNLTIALWFYWGTQDGQKTPAVHLFLSLCSFIGERMRPVDSPPDSES